MKTDNVSIIYSKNLLTDISSVFSSRGFGDLKGKQVFIKPNMFRGADVEESVVTDPKLISAVVSYCKEHGALPVVGDNPVPNKGVSETEIADQCGFISASHECFQNIGKYSHRVAVKNGLLKSVYISETVLNCDLFVSLPKVRSHELTVMSVAVKNHFGIIPGNLKPAIHARFPGIDDFCRVLLDVYALRPPDLIIVDALTFVDARGKKFHPRLLVCGTNGHAIDYVCARITGVDPWRIPTLRLAREQGMFDPSSVVIEGEMPAIGKYRSPFNFPFRGVFVEFFAKWLYYFWLRRRPYIYFKRCTQCGSCERVCPLHAIHDRRIDYRQCIKCFCCFEACPNNAIQTRMKL